LLTVLASCAQLDPEWNQSFAVRGVSHELLDRPLCLEVLDDDPLFDDSLGTAEVSTTTLHSLVTQVVGLYFLT
jgi:hypothetical protein